MPKEIILALVLAAAFLGAIAWLVIYSRLRHHNAANVEQRPQAEEPATARVSRRDATGTRRVVTR